MSEQVPEKKDATRVGKGELLKLIDQKLRASDNLTPMTELAKTLDATVESIQELLQTRGRVNMPGFGTFIRAVSAPRRVRNPQSGETFEVGERIRVRFRSANALTKLMNADNADK